MPRLLILASRMRVDQRAEKVTNAFRFIGRLKVLAMAIISMQKPRSCLSSGRFTVRRSPPRRRGVPTCAFPNLLGGKSQNGTGAVEEIKKEISNDIKYREATGSY